MIMNDVKVMIQENITPINIIKYLSNLYMNYINVYLFKNITLSDN